MEKEIINELYALRAGLSVISGLKDNADAVNERLGNLKSAREEAAEEVRAFNRLRETAVAALRSKDSCEHGYHPDDVYYNSFISDKIYALQEKSEWAEKRLAKLENECDSVVADADKELAAYVSDCELVTSAVRGKYSEILDVRDWENLDLIIYYFETGRADSRKEALQLVDEERRKNEIVSAVSNAGICIAQSINSGFKNLQNALTRSLGTLAEQVGKLSANVASLGGAVRAQTEMMNEGLGKLTSAVEYGSALLEKANISSARLVSDMNYMRNLAENAEIRRRNGQN